MEGTFGCKLGAKRTQFAPNFADFASPNHPISFLECMAGTTGLEPATSAVTVSPKPVTYRNAGQWMAPLEAKRNTWEPLLWP